jgi:hypothetical protein
MNKYALLCLSLVFSVSAHSSDIVIDVPALVGKNKPEVSVLIGAPVSCAVAEYGETCVYLKAETEIVFINGKADWITIGGLMDRPFADTTLELLGFKAEAPTHSNSFSKRWEPLQGVISVAIFKVADSVDYAYIQAYTK